MSIALSPAFLATSLGIVPHIAACALGLSALMNAGARAFMAIRYLGAAYLLNPKGAMKKVERCFALAFAALAAKLAFGEK